MMKKVLLAGMVALAIAAAPQAASAAAILRFDNSGVQGGNLAYTGAFGSSLTGTGITFDEINAQGTSNDGVYECRGCVLNFSTAGSILSVPNSLVQFAVGGSFVVTGDVYDGLMLVASGTLVSGSFTGTPTLVNTGDVQFVASGVDTKDERLLAFLGLTNVNFTFANSEITAASGFGAGNSLNASVTEADLVNTESVPEPVSIALLGMGLLGVGAARRRNRR